MGAVRSNFKVLTHTDKRVIIRDVGPWGMYQSVTNDVENVVEFLHTQGLLPDGCKLYYYDSENSLQEIIVKDGKFVDFDVTLLNASDLD